jgi:hypothetical protein
MVKYYRFGYAIRPFKQKKEKEPKLKPLYISTSPLAKKKNQTKHHFFGGSPC